MVNPEENEIIVDEFRPTVVEHIVIRDLDSGEVILNQRGTVVQQFIVENHLNDQQYRKDEG